MKDLEREETNGYWRTSLEVSVSYVSSVTKPQSADAEAYTAPGMSTDIRGGRGGGTSWVPPGDRVGDGYALEYWRFLLPSESVNFCHYLGYAEILLPSLVGYTGTIGWAISPDGPSGTGNPIVFNPSELAPGAYDVVIGIDTLEGSLEKTITLNVRSLSLTSTRLVVDATDTSTHYLPIDGNGTFIPDDDDFVVISVPEGIDSIDFVPADLEPGTTYTVDIWNGDCGYQTVEVVAVEMKVEPQALFPNYPRSNLGVGEVLDCSVEPSDLNVSWSCTTGKAQFASPNASSTTLSVLDVPGGLTVTASIEGFSFSTNYVVHAPEGIAYSKPYLPARDYIDNHDAGIGCKMDVYLAPTNVAFNHVWMEEGFSNALDVWGVFAEEESYHPPHDGENVNRKFNLRPSPNDGYFFTDNISTLAFHPWSAGGMKWKIPIKWWIDNGSFSTNYHNFGSLWTQNFEIDDTGTTTITKFESSASRFINGNLDFVDSRGEHNNE